MSSSWATATPRTCSTRSISAAITICVRLGIAYRCQPVFGERLMRLPSGQTVPLTPAEAKQCDERFNWIMSSPAIADASVIALASRWPDWAVPRVPAVIEALRAKSSAKIIVFGSTPEFEPEVPRLVESYGRFGGLDEFARGHEVAGRRELNAQLKALVEKAGATYVDKRDILCGAGDCPIFVPDTHALMIYDYGHWTLAGAAYFGARLKQAVPALF